MNGKNCKCGKVSLSYSRHCRDCKNESQRRTRPKVKDITGAERIKLRARWYLKTYIRRGKVERKPCEECGNPKTHAHHLDYSKPLLVRWLCEPCHLKEHGKVAHCA